MKALKPNHLDELKAQLGAEKFSQNPSELATHARDESAHGEFPPDAVFYAESREDVAPLLAYCDAQGVPVTPWGAGTSLEANPVAVRGGVCPDLSRMNQIVKVYPEDLQAVVQPGVVLQDLNARLAKHGLFFPPDPGAPCTVGGMVANNAAGIQAVKYGATKHYVLGLEVVLASGKTLRCGTRAMRTSSGWSTCSWARRAPSACSPRSRSSWPASRPRWPRRWPRSRPCRRRRAPWSTWSTRA